MNFQQLFKLSASKYRYRTPAENEAEVRFFVDSNAEFEMISTLPLDGVVNEFVVHIFKSGQCHSLALALHDILGWPIMGMYSHYGGDRHTSHYMVRCPSGCIGDVEGIRQTDSARRWVNPDTLRRPHHRNFLPAAHDFARHHAPRIAQELLKQMEHRMFNPDWWKK